MKRFLGIILFLLGSLMAQTSELDSLTVQKAVQFAIQHNPEINQLKQQIRFSGADRWQQLGIGTPTISVYEEGKPISTPSALPAFQEKGWRISQAFAFPLKSFFNFREAHLRTHALRLEYEARVRELRARVKMDYARVAYYMELIHLTRQGVEIAEAFKRTVKARLDAGEASELELLNAEIRSQEANNRLLDARWEYDKARYQLFSTIGLDPDNQSYHIVFLDSLRYVEVMVPQEDLLQQLPHLPAIQAARTAWSAARNGVRSAWSSFLPDIAVTYYQQDYGTNLSAPAGLNFYGIEVGLSVPLDVLFNQAPAIQKAKARQSIQQWEYKKQLLDWKKRAEYIWHQYATAMQKLKPYHTETRAKSRQLLNLTLQGYQLGEIDYLSLLEAQRVYLETERNYFKTLLEYSLNVIQMEIFLGKELIFYTEESNE